MLTHETSDARMTLNAFMIPSPVGWLIGSVEWNFHTSLLDRGVSGGQDAPGKRHSCSYPDHTIAQCTVWEQQCQTVPRPLSCLECRAGGIMNTTLKRFTRRADDLANGRDTKDGSSPPRHPPSLSSFAEASADGELWRTGPRHQGRMNGGRVAWRGSTEEEATKAGKASGGNACLDRNL